MESSTIYQNPSATTTLLDLPKSLEINQWSPRSQPANGHGERVFSTLPLELPYPSVEPRESKRAKLLQTIPLLEQEYHKRIQELVARSIEDIRSALGERPWCIPRQYSAVKSKQEDISYELSKQASLVPPGAPFILSPIFNVFPSLTAIQDHVISNPSSQPVQLCVESQTYLVPARSWFVLADVRATYSLLCTFKTALFPSTFDFILMDPPWENTSVRRAQTYSGECNNPFLSVVPVLGPHLKDSGFAGIWVTNKASVRQLVITSLFRRGLRLCEEWIWIKTTLRGEPVTPLDGLWRRPYETLLLFHKKPTSGGYNSEAPDAFNCDVAVTRRVFAAVPDVHSRKPCFKEYVGSLLFDGEHYDALEIFARITTAGWFSWGDQVLEFNEQSHWTKGFGSPGYSELAAYTMRPLH